jgi:hypothetical protein
MKKCMSMSLVTLALLVAGASVHMGTAAEPGRAFGALAWLGVGPRLVEDGYAGGDPGGPLPDCDCGGLGTVDCQPEPGRICTTTYYGCVDAVIGPNTKLCTSGGSYTACSEGWDCILVPAQHWCYSTNCL